jgi:hypothetical protein
MQMFCIFFIFFPAFFLFFFPVFRLRSSKEKKRRNREKQNALDDGAELMVRQALRQRLVSMVVNRNEKHDARIGLGVDQQNARRPPRITFPASFDQLALDDAAEKIVLSETRASNKQLVLRAPFGSVGGGSDLVPAIVGFASSGSNRNDDGITVEKAALPRRLLERLVHQTANARANLAQIAHRPLCHGKPVRRRAPSDDVSKQRNIIVDCRRSNFGALRNKLVIVAFVNDNRSQKPFLRRQRIHKPTSVTVVLRRGEKIHQNCRGGRISHYSFFFSGKKIFPFFSKKKK